MTELVNNAATDLVLLGIGVMPYAARGLTQSLTPIGQAAQLARTVNGSLRDLSLTQFQKYASQISGNDQQPPSCDGVWPGRQVQVDCVAELAFPVGGTAQRPIVPGSDYDDGGFTIYRPRLQMRVVSIDITRDEYGRAVSWNLSLEEA